jgi:RNA polymerase sigma-70 factor (ECF subfamily)
MQGTTDQEINWIELVAQIQAGDAAGSVGLYRIFSRGLRFFVLREIGTQDCDDRVHEILVIVLGSIRKGQLRDPQCLMAFVWTVAHRQIASTIRERTVSRQKDLDLQSGSHIVEQRNNPETEILSRERMEIARNALANLSPRYREVLARFYLHEQSQEQICREMGLTATQFRLAKSRAKAQFGEVGKKLAGKPAGRALNRLETAPLAKKAYA